MSPLLSNPTAVILLFISILAAVHGPYRHHHAYDHSLHVITSQVLDVESIKQQGGESFLSTVLPTTCGNFNVQIWLLPKDMYELCAHHARIYHWQFQHTQPNPPNTAYERPMTGAHSHAFDTSAAARNPYQHRGIQTQQSEPVLDVLTYASRIFDDSHSPQDVYTLKSEQGTILRKLQEILNEITACHIPDTVETELAVISVATDIKNCLDGYPSAEYGEKIENINELLGDLLAIGVIIKMIGSTMHKMPVMGTMDVKQQQMEILHKLSEAIQRTEVLNVDKTIQAVNQNFERLQQVLSGSSGRAITPTEVQDFETKIRTMIKPFKDEAINKIELDALLKELEETATFPQAVQ